MRSRASITLTYILAVLACLYLITPFLWLVGASLSSEKELSAGHLFPRRPALGSYRAFLPLGPEAAPASAEQARDTQVALGAETARGLAPAIANSVVIALSVALVNLLFGSLAAYALARIPSRGNLPLLLFYLVSRS